MKKCTKCGDPKAPAEFSKNSRSKDGLQSQCRYCRSLYYQRDKTRILQRQKERYEANKETISARQRKYYQANRDKILVRVKEYEKKTGNHKRWLLNNADKVLAHSKQYHEDHREEERQKSLEAYRSDPEKHRNETASWRRRHPLHGRTYAARRRIEHPELVKLQSQRYQKAHPERSRYDQRRRKARKLAVNENFTPEQDSFVRTYWGNECAVCARTQQSEEKALAIDHWYPLSKGHALTMGNAVLMCRSCNGHKKDRYPDQVFDAITVARIEAEMKAQTATWESRVADTRMRRFT